MDLLANYGSDEEEDEPTKATTAMPSPSGGKSFFSLPPPRASAQARSFVDEAVRGGGSSVGPRAEPEALPSDFFEDPAISLSKVSRKETYSEAREKPSSLFTKLPPPSSTRFSLANLPPPSKLKKKTVEFKPPVDLSVLESTDEDDSERRKKRSKVSEVSKTGSEAKVGGLASLLPPPKNSLGAGLAFGGGGGGSGGRRTAMETASVSSKSTKEVNMSMPNTVEKEGESAARQVTVSSSESQMRVTPITQYHYSAQPGQAHSAPDPAHSETEWRVPEGHFAQEQHTAAGGFQTGCQEGHASRQYADAYGVASGPSSANSVPDPLAEVLQRERRKGKNESPPQFIEVKQADLTAGRVREDQLRSTGIAFGPNYQPVSSGKDKPSKIHRRKHQIGALYYDMKSKEMEMLDRRSKGNLTKAETQAKYGW